MVFGGASDGRAEIAFMLVLSPNAHSFVSMLQKAGKKSIVWHTLWFASLL